MVSSPIKVDSERCDRSLACVEVCPLNIYIDGGDKIELDKPNRCIRCGHCVAACPTRAISHSLLKTDIFENVADLKSVSFGDALALFKTRRTCRAFLNDPLSRDEIERVIEATRFSPTAANAQNVRYTVITNQEKIRELRLGVATYYLKLAAQLNNPIKRFFISLSQGKKTVQAYRYHMSTILDLFEDTRDGEDRLYYGAKTLVVGVASGVTHIALAAGNMSAMQLMLAAHSLGFGACYNGYTLTALTRDKKLKETIGIEKRSHPVSVIALGKPGIEFRLVPKRRKPRIIWSN